MSSRRKTRIALMLIPLYLIVLVLIFLVAFLYIYRFDIDKKEFNSLDPNYDIIPITSDSIGSNVYLTAGSSGATLLDIYEVPHDDPFIDISVVHPDGVPPVGLTFSLVDTTGSTVSGTVETIKTGDDYIKYRYPFTNTGSEKYTLQYSLGSDASNISSIYIQRVEWKVQNLG